MFSTPGLRSTNYQINENADNLLQAKKGNNLLPSRKPLGDKTVNEKSPLKITEKMQKEKEIPTVLPNFANDDLWADFCSYKDVKDEIEDILPHSECLNVSGIVNILNSYAHSYQCSTPTPEEVYPESPSLVFDRFNISISDDDMSAHEESVGDVTLPDLDLYSF